VTLAHWLKDRAEPVPFADAAELIAALAGAVEHAHQRGVLHRDLKPSNILLAADARRETQIQEPGPSPVSAGGTSCSSRSFGICVSLRASAAKITDFGLAKFLLEATRPGQTLSGAIVGTPHYMAPEQAAGKVRDVGPAADVYALGAILYELLTGRPPFVGETDLDTLVQVQADEPLPPGRHRSGVPRDLETVCLKCLHKEPAKRYASAGALADDLRRFLEDRPVRARRPTPLERAGRWARRHRPVVWSAGVSAVVLVALALVGLTVSNVRIRSEADQKERALEEARANHERAEERRREAYDNFKLALKAVDDCALKVAQDPRLRERDLLELRTDLLRSAVEFYRQFVAQRRDDPALQIELARACRRLGGLVSDMGNLEEAVTSFRQSVDILTELLRGRPDDLNAWRGLTEGRIQLGRLYRQTNLARAEAEYQEALKVPDRLLQSHPDDPGIRSLLAASHTNLGNVYRDTSRADLAEEAYRAGRAIQLELVRDHPDVPHYAQDLANSHNNLGALYDQRGHPDQAVAELQKALAISRRLTQAHPHAQDYLLALSAACNNLGRVEADRKNWPQAESAFQEAVTALERHLKDHANVTAVQRALAGTHDRLATLYYGLRQVVPAERELAKALAILEPLASRHPNVADITFTLAACHLHAGYVARDLKEQPEVAHAWFSKTIERCEAILKQEPRQYSARSYVLWSTAARAPCLTQLGRHAEALADWRRAIELAGGKDLSVRAGYACGLAAAGDHAAARAEVNALAQVKELSADACFNLACACALCNAAVRPDPAAEDDAARAVALLARAQAAGYFQTPHGGELLKKRKDLDSLRRREDFLRLLNGLSNSK
jgi:eukaryotic-like serine/threonine-protein kinase